MQRHTKDDQKKQCMIDFFCSLTESEFLMSELDGKSLTEENLQTLR